MYHSHLENDIIFATMKTWQLWTSAQEKPLQLFTVDTGGDSTAMRVNSANAFCSREGVIFSNRISIPWETR